VTNRATGTTTRATQGSGGGGAVTRNQAGLGGLSGAGRTASGDMYAGRDGNVYRNEGGGWQQYDSGGWNAVDRPAQRSHGTTGRLDSGQRARVTNLSPTTRDQLNSDRVSRGDGQRRTNDLGSVRSSGGGSRAGAGVGSYRPSGGASRGGGGGRRR
jgi:hypothetical protein